MHCVSGARICTTRVQQLRITIGTESEVKAVHASLGRFVAGNK